MPKRDDGQQTPQVIRVRLGDQVIWEPGISREEERQRTLAALRVLEGESPAPKSGEEDTRSPATLANGHSELSRAQTPLERERDRQYQEAHEMELRLRLLEASGSSSTNWMGVIYIVALTGLVWFLWLR